MLLGVFIPFFNWATIVLFGRRLGKMGVLYVTIFSTVLTVGVNCYNFFIVTFTPIIYYFKLGPWIQLGLLQVDWEFMIDFISTSMLCMVSIISCLVHVYSLSYMKTDPHFIRFISYLSLFTFFMFVLVSAANLVVLFVGWEGVGICSYLLINFWFTRGQANKAALKALFMNRVGDMGFLLGTVLLFSLTGSVDFSSLSVLVPIIYEQYDFIFWEGRGLVLSYLDLICLTFFLGVVGKSAQIGLHTWLPAAMEGPTPVSALIHAATMVTAGIFLLIRCAFLFECSPVTKSLIVIFGAVTALLSALTAIFLFDIKKIIAYSTCSQLGYMAVACGMSQYTLGLFHLINHAFFKALLFLTAGAIIHSFNNEQDIRRLSGIAERAPFLHVCMLVGTIAIMGLPFLSGFYSKDLIIEIVYLQTAYIFNGSWFLYGCIIGATLGTGIYSFRLYYFLFLRQGYLQNISRGSLRPITQPFFIQFAIVWLLLGSIFSGYFLNECFHSLENWGVALNSYEALHTIASNFSSFENEFLPWQIKLLPFILNISIFVCGMGLVSLYHQGLFYKPVDFLFFSYYIYLQKHIRILFTQTPIKGRLVYMQVYTIARRKFAVVAQAIQANFYFNELYNYFAAAQIYYYLCIIFMNLDKGGLELAGPTGLERLYKRVVKLVRVYYNMGLSSHLLVMYYTIVFCFYFIDIF